MTKNQERAIEVLKREFAKYYSYSRPEEYEFKEVFVEFWEDTGIAYVRLEYGMIGDEGTLAECFCRDQTAVCIGKRGGYFTFSEGKNHSYQCLSLLDAITLGNRRERARGKKYAKKKEA